DLFLDNSEPRTRASGLVMRESSQRSANLQLHLGPRKNEGIAEARVSTDNQLTVRVLRLSQMLDDTIPTTQLTTAELDKAIRVIDRRTTAYSSALTLIGILFNGMGVSLAEPSDAVPMPGFLFDM